MSNKATNIKKVEKQMIKIDNEEFEADKDFILLLQELNRVGLKTTQHCAGHTKKNRTAYLSIQLHDKMTISINRDDQHGGKRLVIWWCRDE